MSGVLSSSDLLDSVKTGKRKLLPASAEKEDELEYDLGNLAAFDTTSKVPLSNEKQLLELTRDNAQLLFNQIFELPTEQLPVDFGQGRLATLPEPSTELPREKPPPKPKEATKWEKFAALKGIQKRKRSKLVYDEDHGDWKRRHGYDRANDESQDWVIEAKTGDDGSVDPWTKMKQEKKERVAKNQKQQLKNLQAAEGERVAGTLDLTSAMVPKQKRAQIKSGAKRQHHVDVALGIAQHATASVGVFDTQRYKEPKKKELAQAKGKPARDTQTEKKQSLSVLAKVLGPETEMDRFDFNKAANLSKAQVEKADKAAKENKKIKKQLAAKATGKIKKKPQKWRT